MAASRTLTGIDIGRSAIKIVRLVIDGDAIAVTRAIKIPLGHEAAAPEAIEGRLKASLSEAGLHPLRAPVAVAASDLILRYQHLIPSESLNVVDIVKFEVSEVDDKVAGGVAYDFEILDLPGELARSGQGAGGVIVLTVMAKNDYLDGLARQLTAGGIRTRYVTPLSVALSATLTEFGRPDRKEIVLLIDIGSENTTVVAARGERPFWMRTMPFGGEAITRAIMRRLRIDRAEAEKMKRTTAHVMETLPGGPTDRREMAVCETATRQVEQLVSIIQSSLRFAEAQLKSNPIVPNRIILSGGTSKLTGIVPLMEQRFGAPVSQISLPGRAELGMLSHEERLLLTHNGPQFAAAVGCALGGRPHATPFRLRSARQQERSTFLRRHLFVYAGVLLVILALLFRTFWFSRTRDHLLAALPLREIKAEAAGRESALIESYLKQRAALAGRKVEIENQIGGQRFLQRIGAGMASPTGPLALPQSCALVRLKLEAPTAGEKSEPGVPYVLSIVVADRGPLETSLQTIIDYLARIPLKSRYIGRAQPLGYEIRLYDRSKESSGA